MSIPSAVRLDNARILIYSHDTFGLGHLRRCRAIAHEIVERFKGVSILILSGSSVIGSFDFKSRVDFVRIPGVIKLQNGEYTSLSLHIDLSEILSIRESIIRQTAKAYAPDIFIVDKEPLGLHGEVRQTLIDLKAAGASTVLGIRDVMDDKDALLNEWVQKQVFPNIDTLYDEIWVYGTRDFYQPLQGLPLEPSVHNKTIYTGFLRRALTGIAADDTTHDTPYLLVTPGGGRDGEALIDLVLNTYEKNLIENISAVIVLGPFMHVDDRAKLSQRAAKLEKITLIDFHPRIEVLIEQSMGMLAMGGYNTFCEILSFDKPALLYPRLTPRAEQLIRCQRADELGMIKMLDPNTVTTKQLAKDIIGLKTQAKPSQHLSPNMLDGMRNISNRILNLLPKTHIKYPKKSSTELMAPFSSEMGDSNTH